MSVCENIKTVLKDISEACINCGREPQDVKLLAVSKRKPVEMMIEAYECGQRDFGENRVHEALEKFPTMPEDSVFHLIGHLQSNKVGKACKIFKVIHSVDSVKLAKKIDSKCEELGKIMDIYLDVNISGEESKTGFEPDCDFIKSVEEISKLKNINLLGLMAMGPNIHDKELIRKKFSELSLIMEDLNMKLGLNMDRLSTGMSGDYREAIAEGSTMVRIGSAIFGMRS